MILKAMVVDDELFARKDLCTLAQRHRGVEVAWEAASLEGARQLLRAVQPDVVFLDVQLDDGCGFDLLPLTREPTQVVFVTAHDRYAIRAFEVNALDYLLKPVSVGRFAESIARVLQRRTGNPCEEPEPTDVTVDDRISVGNRVRPEFVRVLEVVAVTSLGSNYTQVCKQDGSRLDTRRTIRQWEAMLPKEHFVRVHRAAIVNLDYIDGVTRKLGGKLVLEVRHLDNPISVSRRNARPVGTVLNRHLEMSTQRGSSA